MKESRISKKTGSTPGRCLAGAAVLVLTLGMTTLRTENASDQSDPYQNLYYHPQLVLKAAEQGVWPGMRAVEEGASPRDFFQRTQATYVISEAINPYFLNGDFDDDGLCDLAIAVLERDSGRIGIAIVPGHLDTVYLYNVGPGMDPEHYREIRGMDVEYLTGPYVRRFDRDRLIVYRKEGPATAIEVIDGELRTYLEPDSSSEIPDPQLVLEARRDGLWPEGIRYEIIRQRDRNPAWLRGDFNGDGEFDLAVLVRDTSNREQGIVIIHSTQDSLHGTLDSLHTIFPSTAGPGQGGMKAPGRIFLIPKGEKVQPFQKPDPEDAIRKPT